MTFLPVLSLASLFLTTTSFSFPQLQKEPPSPLIITQGIVDTSNDLFLEEQLHLSFVTISDPGNKPSNYYDGGNATGFGSVDRVYEIGKFDITAAQYCSFLNAVASQEDTYGLFNENMTSDENIACIQRIKIPQGYLYEPIVGSFPITYISLSSAMRFCNWLDHHQATGLQDENTTETGSYIFTHQEENGVLKERVTVNPEGTYFLPTEDQWVKAAYYYPAGYCFIHLLPYSAGYWDFPDQSMIGPDNNIGSSTEYGANYRAGFLSAYTKEAPPYLTPIGSFGKSTSYYGAFDMGGNVFQWTSTAINPESNDSFVIARGGSWHSTHSDLLRKTRLSFDPTIPRNDIGFRIVKTI